MASGAPWLLMRIGVLPSTANSRFNPGFTRLSATDCSSFFTESSHDTGSAAGAAACTMLWLSLMLAQTLGVDQVDPLNQFNSRKAA